MSEQFYEIAFGSPVYRALPRQALAQARYMSEASLRRFGFTLRDIKRYEATQLPAMRPLEEDEARTLGLFPKPERRPAPAPTVVPVVTPAPRPGLRSAFCSNALRNARRVVVLGGGPSLRKFDWKLLRGEVVIGCNRSFEQPHVGTVVTIDERFVNWAEHGNLPGCNATWRDFPGHRIICSNKEDSCFPGCVVVPEGDAFPPRMNALGHGVNSGYYALLVAWALGARDIMLLGFDLKGQDGKQVWYHDGYEKQDPHWRYKDVDDQFAGFRADFERAAPALAAAGVKVRVYGDSALSCFPKSPLSSAHRRLRNKPIRPLVVNFYTPETSYETEAREMARTATAFGLEVLARPIKTKGGWDANTRYKATFLRRILKEVDRPIVWLDADARIRQYPDALDAWAASSDDLALCFIDWDTFPNTRRRGLELDSAVMGLRPTDATFALLNKWIRRNYTKDGKAVFEQRVLQNLLSGNEHKCSVTHLPMPYFQIFDAMKQLGDPVIEQLQASRRLKSEVGQ